MRWTRPLKSYEQSVQMNLINVGIEAFATALPTKIISLSDIAKSSGLSEDELALHLNFKQKKVIDSGQTAVDLGVSAVNKVLTSTSLTPDGIDCIIYASSGVNDYQAWSPSAYIQQAIKADSAFTLDIQNGCNSFTMGMHLAHSLLLSHGHYKKILLVVCDVTSPLIDYSDRGQLPFFANADGASALILSKHDNDDPPTKRCILSQRVKTQGKYHAACQVPWGGLVQLSNWEATKLSKPSYRLNIGDPNVVELRGGVIVDGYCEVIKKALADANVSMENIRYCFVTQHTVIVLEHLLNQLNIQRDKLIKTSSEFGHVGSIDPLLAYERLESKGKITRGDHLLLATAGVGYHWGAQVIRA